MEGASQFVVHEATWQKTSQDAHADPSPLLDVPTMCMKTGPQSNGRRRPALMDHIFFYITWMAECSI